MSSFQELFEKEDKLLTDADVKASDIAKPKSEPSSTANSAPAGANWKVESPGPAGEPWIKFTATDRVGLAFSGGGIRSATFNLGVLKALNELNILKHVDYLSTVSGGGYIGAWWTAWRARNGPAIFPSAPKDAQNREPEEVRHLREFSNFLSPRIGFFQTEMWNAVMAVVSAVLMAVLVASAVIAFALLVWLGIITLVLADGLDMTMSTPNWFQSVLGNLSFLPVGLIKNHLAPLVILFVLLIVHCIGEHQWRTFGKAELIASSKSRDFLFHFAMMVIVGFAVFCGWNSLLQFSWVKILPTNAELSWKRAVGISADHFSFSPYLFAGSLLLVGIALILLVPRLVVMRFFREIRTARFISAADRALSRLLGTALVSGALALVWLSGCWLTSYSAKLSGSGAVIAGSAFAFLRKWVGRMGPAKKGGMIDLLKPLLPQALAYIAIILWTVCIAALLANLIQNDRFTLFRATTPWALFFVATFVILFAILFFDPAQVSMHSFYRNRLCRAYLGASNRDACRSSEKNRQTDVRLRDDIALRDLSSAGKEKPLHLVCCAANDLAGDHLENLSRGARSAVLSRFGISIGNYWHGWGTKEEEKKALGLASAITASAAAFNSNMGSLSMTLGAGVTFLCTALNLRLGLWLAHPICDKAGAPSWFPGLLFLKEMFGLTYSGLKPRSTTATPVANYVHLSDGAHFENLALYELVRRHCRYIIVSDCGADTQVAFDDFGNAIRRIREDFGVEIDIDLSPLKPKRRISKQHVAVGTITYDPRGEQTDTGVLVYLKPTLTGDEPCDITQYRTRNQDFPHESTGDQFYDEAQWESYRRLGEHATRSALRFVERVRAHTELVADDIFNGARWEWYQSPPQLAEKFVEFTARFTSLEAELRDKAPKQFVSEMFPELQFIEDDGAPENPMTSDETARVLHFLLQIIQLMEDAWVGCSLETHWNDPHNLGWINAFQRWAYTPSFRLWWPVLKPMFGAKFRRFMEERLSLADEDYPPTWATVHNRGQNVPDGVAKIYWTRINGSVPSNKTVYSFDLNLTFQHQEPPDAEHPVQAGLAFVDLSPRDTDPPDKRTARWSNEEFFVPPSLWGAGLGAKFLDNYQKSPDRKRVSLGLLQVLKKDGVQRCEVTIESPDAADSKLTRKWLKRTDLASRQQRADLLAFYQRARFTLDNSEEANTRLVRDLDDVVIDNEENNAP